MTTGCEAAVALDGGAAAACELVRAASGLRRRGGCRRLASAARVEAAAGRIYDALFAELIEQSRPARTRASFAAAAG
jgi:hypothetical protein